MALTETGTHAPVWLHALLDSYPKNNRGRLYEERFEEACQVLVSTGYIDGYEVSPKHSKKDCEGIDATIRVNRREIPFQITSTTLQLKEHILVNERNGRPPINFILVRKNDTCLLKTIEELENEILDILTN
jgi:hypothetical protein